MTTTRPLPDDYGEVLAELSAHVRRARGRTQLRANVELVQLYHAIGRTLLARQRTDAWGSGVLDRVAQDLRAEFPSMTGLSRTNLKYMRAFARAWPHGEAGPEGQRAVDLLPGGHITVLLGKLPDGEARDRYAAVAVAQGWSRNVLVNRIMSRSLERTGAPPCNFDAHLAPEDSDLARELGRDPYVFDFLEVGGTLSERAMEQALIDRLADTLRELGSGFAFVGRQVRFTVDDADALVDLLFFHIAS
ncbi:PDDEXK nuclease domain-containing protein [Clavibacter sp. MX14-G9D]|uniref:PDDEXK nuclease domain-containing protein n=1 Tax=Clavibacter sp. MX14-G9D TaxID=3064656 RepID=UPI00293F003D|nr:PDDEXK nuclease domain-containing protein [Clavibacter sp. MX14-G9D]